PYTPIQKITGNPESFDGRMKTISFQIESALLYDRRKESHLKEAKKLAIPQIDIVACNLYPFEQTVAKKDASHRAIIENIDVGGPTMLRAAAQNGLYVATDPADYPAIIAELSAKKKTQLIPTLQTKAFSHLSFYDSQVAAYFTSQSSDLFPQELTIAGRKSMELRYGENPHQKAAVYLEPNVKTPFGSLRKRWGRDLSLINLTDINAGIASVRIFREPAAVVIKHNSPSAIALGATPHQALSRAIDADPESAFGGIIVLNKPMDIKAARVIGAFKDARRGNIDIIAAPSIAQDALAFLQSVRKTMGIYTFGLLPKLEDPWNIKSIDGGFVLQTADLHIDASFSEWKIVTKKKPTTIQLRQMRIGWKFATKIRSNTILIIDKSLPMTRGIGSGQTSRVRSARIALEQAGNHAKGAILVSDSFFPFPDNVDLAVKHGIAAIVQQGGSVNDQQSIDAADRAGIPMVCTGRRAFWH
ncbi:bifunctional phosphoribosylaminoimidazolecarboxamide formyltransferase/IMP cyclohydrolase, partial [Candidatus Microgenomates bacterium]|nr:bifunctional phosphoribosylaminoimidazolecarboxamide formyltransferase/IMP cyclohydrolase [Candidatus Microgenomates bacterium]